MRITGLASGLDVDTLVKTSLKPYQTKVDQTTQKKDIIGIKQKLYKDIASDTSKFFDKYLDILKNDSLLKPSNYKAVGFTSSNEDVVSLKASSESPKDNYEVTVNKIAKAASAVISGTDVVAGNKVVVNGKEITLSGTSGTEIAKNLNAELSKNGIKVTARYTDFAGTSSNVSGIVLESSTLGKDSTFTVGASYSALAPSSATNGLDGTASKTTGFTIQNIKDANGKITIGTTDIDFGIVPTDIDSDIIKKMNDKLSSQKLSVSNDGSGNITFSSTAVGSTSSDPQIKINGNTGTFTGGTDATASVATFNKSDLNSKILINGNVTDLTGITTEADFNKLLQDKGVTAKDNGDGTITLTSMAKGASSVFTVSKAGATSGITPTAVTTGTDADVQIKNTTTGGIVTYTGNTNTKTLDGTVFTFSGVTNQLNADGTTTNNPVKITAKNDVKDLKDKLVGFINDYNTLIEKLNTTVMTKHDRGYMPLTADQKKEMSADEVKLWNEKVEQGQLYKDSDLTRIANSMKQTMRTVMSGSGLNLEKIGITPVNDYAGTKNGTFTIDEDKLTTALQDKTEDVMNLFIAKPATTDTTISDYTSKTGVLQQLKDTINKEMKSSTSILSKKVGLNPSTFTNNELTKSISDYEKKIKDMQKDVSRREQSFYSKFATLEKMMNQYNSQQSNLMSQLGMK